MKPLAEGVFLNIMAALDASQSVEGLKEFLSKRPWDLSFLDDQSPAGQKFRSSMNDLQPFDDMFDAPFDRVPQLPNTLSRKRKRTVSLDPGLGDFPGASLTSGAAATVVYDARGNKRGADFMDYQHAQSVEPEEERRTNRSGPEMERACATLSMLPGVVAILRYACGCRSPQGTCNHHSFSSGLALPDGVICDGCSNQAIAQVGQETEVPAGVA